MTTHAMKCPLCARGSQSFRLVDQVAYFECPHCDFIFADPALLAKIDAGEVLRKYDASYWETELASSRERSFGSSLSRVAETVLYARHPITRFVDICGGPGYLLDAITYYLPTAAPRFFSVERFPPDAKFCTTNPNYHIGDLTTFTEPFQAGVCVEVFEHLTPTMARQLASDLARVSDRGAFYLFNTGLTDYVKREDPNYLDPFVRGHITSWSVTAARRIFEPVGFSVLPLPGKTWAFALEFQADGPLYQDDLIGRIWSVLPANKALLHDPATGSLMYSAGIDAARAYRGLPQMARRGYHALASKLLRMAT